MSLTELTLQTLENCEICKLIIENDIASQPGCKHRFHHKCLFNFLIKTSSHNCPKCGDKSYLWCSRTNNYILCGIFYSNKSRLFQLVYTYMMEFKEMAYACLVGIYGVPFPFVLKIKLKNSLFRFYISFLNNSIHNFINQKEARKAKCKKLK